MPHYIAVVHKDADSAFGISFPDLPGCFSAADTSEDLIANAMEALELWSDDIAEMPAASTIEALRSDQAIQAELAAGAMLVSVPFVRNIGKSARINITLDKGLLEAIDDAASRRKMTRSGFLAQAAMREIGN